MCCIFKNCSLFSPRHPLKSREQSSHSDTCVSATSDILMDNQQNSHQAEYPNALWSGVHILQYVGVQIWKLCFLVGNSLQGSHYNIMVPTTSNKNLELITQKCEWGSHGATALIWLQKSKRDLKSRFEKKKCAQEESTQGASENFQLVATA